VVVGERVFERSVILSVGGSNLVHVFDRTSVRTSSGIDILPGRSGDDRAGVDRTHHINQHLHLPLEATMSSILDLEHLHPTHPAHRPYREALANEATGRVRHLSLVPAPSHDDPRPVRLTRRGRLAMFISTLLMLGVLGVVLGSTTVATDAPGAPVPATMVTINPGQTLWDIAAQANPTGDIQVTVDDIMKLNSMSTGSSLHAGDTIAVPLYK
jgi:hypothetical protein